MIIQGDQKVSVHLMICIVIVRCPETFWSPCITPHGAKSI